MACSRRSGVDGGGRVHVGGNAPRERAPQQRVARGRCRRACGQGVAGVAAAALASVESVAAAALASVESMAVAALGSV
eukprot:361316-Chlamydomonas_euryale.AAC.2